MDTFLATLTVFSIIGVIALIALFLENFTSLGYRSKILFSDDPAPVNSKQFLASLAGVTGVSVINTSPIKILQNGDEFLASLLDDIASAQTSINFMVYLWSSGRMSEQIISALSAKASHGVKVKVLLDHQGTSLSAQKDLEQLRSVGGQISTFRPFKLGKISRWHRRNHRRAIIIDGQIGYLGGITVTDAWLGQGNHPRRWRDFMFRSTGELVSQIQSAFAQLWATSSGEILSGLAYYPKLNQSVKNQSALSFISSPSFDTPMLDKVWWLTISAAKKRIYIMSPFLTPYPSILNALITKAKSGVDVRILVPGPHLDNHKVRYAGQDNYANLLQAGVRIYEFQPAMLHTKLVLVDNHWSLIGSANLDIRSIRLNEEHVIGIQNQNFTQKLMQIFQDDLSSCLEINLDNWNQRPWWHKLRSKFFKLFQVQF